MCFLSLIISNWAILQASPRPTTNYKNQDLSRYLQVETKYLIEALFLDLLLKSKHEV